MPLTNDQYLAKKGVVCPNCSSKALDVGSGQFDGAHFYQGVQCLSCLSKWTDELVLRGYSGLNVPAV